MSELNEAALKLLFEEELFIIKDNNYTEPQDTISVMEVSEPTVSAPKPEPEANPTEHSTAAPIVFKGENKKGIVILYQNPEAKTLAAADESLLLNILKAVGLSLEDVAIINQSISNQDWKDEIEFTKVLSFGINPTEYGLSGENYSIIESNNGTWLSSHTLAELANDKVLKGKLWGKLKEMFLGE